MKIKKIPSILFLLIFTAAGAFSNDLKLLVNGKQAFPQIIECIQNAQESVYINMFIWRDDKIGNTIAEECLNAADRGVKITISKDVYGSVCEHAEESGTSFFHKKCSFAERIKINTLKLMYKNPIDDAKDAESDLYKKIMNHPNITVQAEDFKADHSKFYIFDDKILILGGINIEDKENGQDLSGRVYNDYMLLLDGADYVKDFKSYCNNSKNIYFGMNKKAEPDIFEMEKMYLDLINSSKEELTIVMAYFSPLPKFIDAILAASERGVKVKIVIPSSANFQDSSNKAAVKKLLQKSGKNNGNIQVFYSPKMLHTKLIANENLISFGSCNITKKAFNQLDELNVFITADESELFDQIMQNVQATFAEARQIQKDQIKYNHFLAFLEGFLV